MNYLKFILFLVIILVFSCKTIEKKVYSKIAVEITEIYYFSGFSENIKINGKLLLNYDQIDIDMDYNDGSIYDLSSDATSDMIAKTYIYDKNSLKEFKKNEIYFSGNSEIRLKDLMNKYEINLVKFDDNASGEYYKLNVKLVNYETGEYNLIRNIGTKVQADIELLKSEKAVFTLKKIYEINSDIVHPTEKLRLDGIINKINSDIVDMLDKLISKNKVEKEN